MSAIAWMAAGSLLTLSGMATAVVYVLRALGRRPDLALDALAGLVRSFATASRYRSVIIVRVDSPVVVSFDEIALAIEKGDLLTHAPVRVERATTTPLPPRDGEYDGRA